jgi:hypothetical protein
MINQGGRGISLTLETSERCSTRSPLSLGKNRGRPRVASEISEPCRRRKGFGLGVVPGNR